MLTIENRAGVDVLVMGKGAQPATEAESAFYVEVVRLRADVEALRADAERWRWISSQGWCPFSEADDAWDSPAALTIAVDENIATDAARAARGDQG